MNLNCPYCNRELRTPAALKMHSRFCARNQEKARGSDAQDILTRRKRVMELHVQGHSIKVIAGELNVSSGTVCADLKALLTDVRSSIDMTPMIERVAHEVQLVEAMEERARADYFAISAKKNPALRFVAISRWREIFKTKIEVLQNFGLLPKTPDDLRVSVQTKDYTRMSRQELDAEIQKEREELMRIDDERKAILAEAEERMRRQSLEAPPPQTPMNGGK